MSDVRPIGVFDSGVGGISVLKELVKLMPHENFIYFGDSANAPYGTKPRAVVEELTLATADRLVGLGVKALVIACNTATAAAVHLVRARYPELPVIGIEPALKPAVLHSPGGTIVVLATDVTLSEPKFARLLDTYRNQASIHTIGCPEIVPHVEAGDISSEELDAYLTGRLLLALRHSDEASEPEASDSDLLAHIDGVVLGCTHYPFIRGLLAGKLRSDCFIIDGGPGTAREAARRLRAADRLTSSEAEGRITFLNSDPEKIALEEKLFCLPL